MHSIMIGNTDIIFSLKDWVIIGGALGGLLGIVTVIEFALLLIVVKARI